MSFSIHHSKPSGDYKDGSYRLKNPKKFIGIEKEVKYRSSYELDAYKFFDTEPNVIRWCAESDQIKIPYRCSIDNGFHHYFPDAYAEILRKDKSITKYVFEIKPKIKLIPPDDLPPNPTTRQKKSYNRKMKEFIRIMDKKKAAIEWCRERGFKYDFITEDFLYKK